MRQKMTESLFRRDKGGYS